MYDSWPPVRCRTNRCAALLLTGLLLLPASALHAQTSPGWHWEMQPAAQASPPIAASSTTQSATPPTFPFNANQDSLVSVIVEFREPPYYLARRDAPVSTSMDFYEERLQDFAADLAGLRGSDLDAAATVQQAYVRVFFGAVVQVPQRLASGLAGLPYVKAVRPDAEVIAYLDESVRQIRADAVWDDYGTRGEDVVVGIIDTGIDYTHPALGGGLGAGFKVIGGYDFVNDDADPMDDHGHGTHVAGIVAADGAGLRGVAPGAKLVAYKALDDQGRGLTSTIIAAIERAVDPNGDGNLSDRLDVVNISLGSPLGLADDPASVAVDQATQLGVTFVVAAGNEARVSGDTYFQNGSESIGSPGAARLAITVGAVDATDGLAPWSSRGPVGGTFAVKPDVVAPGVAITSTARGGGEVAMSGTSMAAPHVAGVVALLKSLHPGWTPAQIKSALVHTAHDGGHRVMQQGGGRVDAWRAAGARTHAVPSALSFGLDDPQQATWTLSEPLWIYNQASETQSYTLTAGGLRSGITLTATPQAFSLPAGDSLQVTMTLSVSNGTIPLAPDDIPIYEGAVTITGTLDTLRLPWAFVRASLLRLTFSDPAPRFIGSGTLPELPYFDSSLRSVYRHLYWPTPYQADVVGLPSGTYTLATVFPEQIAEETPVRFVLREGISMAAGGTEVHVDAAEAVHPVHFDGVDEAGRPLREVAQDQWQVLVLRLPPFRDWLVGYSQGRQDPAMYVSALPSTVALHAYQGVAGFASTGRIYLPQFPARYGAQQAIRLTNDPAQYVRQLVRVHVPEEAPQARVATLLVGHFRNEEELGTTYLQVATAVGDGIVATPDGFAEAEVFLTPPADPDFVAAPYVYVNYTDLGDRVDVETPPLNVVDDSVVVRMPAWVTASSYHAPAGDTLHFNTSLVYPFNTTTAYGGDRINFFHFFRGALREQRYQDNTDGQYALYDAEGHVVHAGSLADARDPMPVEAGVYRLELTTQNRFVRGQRGTMRYTERIDLDAFVPRAPSLMDVRLLGGTGKPRDAVARGEAVRLQVAAKTDANPPYLPVLDGTQAYYRVHGQEAWQEAPVRKVRDIAAHEGTLFEADLTAATALDSVGIDVRFVVEGEYGNTTTYELIPAFAVGAWAVGTDTEPVPPPALATMLHASYPNPFVDGTTLAFTLSHPAHVKLEVYDLLGRRVALVLDEDRTAGRHEVAWDARAVAGGVYFSRMTVGGHVHTHKLVAVH